MFRAQDCTAIGLPAQPMAAGRFRGDGRGRDWRMVPPRFCISITERGVAEERFAWGRCAVKRGQLIMLWPNRWHDLTEGGGRRLDTVWMELDGPGLPALASAFGVRETAPVVSPREPNRALSLLRQLVDRYRDPRPLPPSEFAWRLFALAELCGGASWRARDERPASLIEQAEALWNSEPLRALTPAELSARLGVHANTLLHGARTERGVTAAQLVLAWKVERARRLLVHTELKVAAVARASGFRSTSHFSRAMVRVTGKRPGAVRGDHPPPRAAE